jgi:hypothetical protein
MDEVQKSSDFECVRRRQSPSEKMFIAKTMFINLFIFPVPSCGEQDTCEALCFNYVS